MERENTRTCVPAHDTAIPQIPTFVELVKEHCKKGGHYASDDIELWNKCSGAKKIKLLEAVRSGEHYKPRLDWLITDFPEPRPHILSGMEQEQMLKQGQTPCLVKYDGRFVAVTEQEMNLFGLQFVRKITP